jgi:hypothetical protein
MLKMSGTKMRFLFCLLSFVTFPEATGRLGHDLVMASTNKKMSIVPSFKLLQGSEGKIHLQEIDYTEI